MKVIELLKIDRKVLELLQESCVKVGDVHFVGLYDDFMRIVKSGGKTTYAVAVLSQKYKISERKVYYLMRKFTQDCNVCAP